MAEYRSYRPTASSLGWSLRTASIGLTAFALTCLALNATVTRHMWRTDLGVLDQKFEAFEAQRDTFSLVFMGTSRFKRGVTPRVFDEALREEGLEIRSFNLAVESMTAQEYLYCLDRLDRLAPEQLRWVVIEPSLHGTPVPSQWLTARVRSYSRPDWSWPVLRAKWKSNRPFTRRLGAVASIAAATALHLGNLGVLSDVLRPDVALSGVEPTPFVTGGPSEHADAHEIQEHRAIAAVWSAWAEAPPSTEARAVTKEEAALQSLLYRRISELGATPLTVSPPSARSAAALLYASQDAARQALPEGFHATYTFGRGGEDFYTRVAWWRDPAHLNLTGAEVLSRQLARDCSPFLSAPR